MANLDFFSPAWIAAFPKAQTAEIGALRVTLALEAGEFSRGARAALSDLDKLAGRMADFGDRMNRGGVMLSARPASPRPTRWAC